MESSIEFEPENALCVYRFSGQVTGEGVLRTFREARTMAGWSDDYDFLSILDRVSLIEIRVETIEDMMATLREFDAARPVRRRRAAIVCDDPFAKAALTFWETASQDRLTTEERIFQYEAQARAWLASPRDISETAG